MGDRSTVTVIYRNNPTTFSFDSANLSFSAVSTRPLVQVPLRQVLAADLDLVSRTLSVTYLRRRSSGLTLSAIAGKVKEAETATVQSWTDSLLALAYKDVKRGRSLKVFVNPFGGVAKGRQIFTNVIEPILRAASCTLDVTYTTHHGHAVEVAKSLPLNFDAVLSVSGDGLIHEILNGFALHDEPIRALATPLTPIPTGSGNGLSVNLLGLKDGFDVGTATLNAIKGQPMKVDVFSLIQNGKRSLTFMSQSLGLAADMDLGTEHLRWMGDTRFAVGVIRGLTKLKPCLVELYYKPAEVDKLKMVDAMKASHTAKPAEPHSSIDPTSDTNLPPLKYATDDSEGWVKFDQPIFYIYGGKGPYVGRDLMSFPVSVARDGFIDLAVQTISSRGEILKTFTDGKSGSLFWNDSYHYIKAEAYRVKPLTKTGYFSVDGEPFPYEEFQVEAHSQIATLLSPFGHYAAEFKVPPPKSKKYM